TGVIGRRLLPLLMAEEHQVTAMTRSPQRVESLRAQGAEPVVADALDAGAVRAAVMQARPDAVIHQLTSLPARIDPRRIDRDFELNDRLRSEGTRILVRAAQEAGASRVLAQSIAFVYAPGPARTVRRESDPLLAAADAPGGFARSADAVSQLEHSVLAA